MKNDTYDILKYIALQVIPALEVLLIAIGEIWSIGIMGKVAATVAAVGVFLGAILIRSTKKYNEVGEQDTFNEDGLSMFEGEEPGYEDTDGATGQ